jgi:hypothetical protein
MRSITARDARQVSIANSYKEMVRAVAYLACFVLTLSPVSALVAAPIGSFQPQFKQDSATNEARTRGGVVRRITFVDSRGKAAGPTVVRRTTFVDSRGKVASPTVVRRGVVARPGRWVRPAHYYWRPGGAIAAGVAIGFVAAAAAASWAGEPPAPGYCWYYTDPDQTQGFWDVCP